MSKKISPENEAVLGLIEPMQKRGDDDVSPQNGKHCNDCPGSLAPSCKKYGCLEKRLVRMEKAGIGPWMSQSRKPAGQAGGGQWTSANAGAGQMSLFGQPEPKGNMPTPEAKYKHPDAMHFTKKNKAEGELNGVAFKSWTPPKTDAGWAKVPGQKFLPDEPPYFDAGGKRAGSGVIIVEPDGRVWITEPANHFGGYVHTFPKGGLEQGISPQANAIKEAYEETGLKVEITGYLGDFNRDTSVARYYVAKRTGGTPDDRGWESQAVKLVPPQALEKYLNRSVDKEIAGHVLAMAFQKRVALLNASIAAVGLRLPVDKAYNPSQPREPAGSSKGGQFASQATYSGSPHAGAKPENSWFTNSPNHQNHNKIVSALYELAQANDLAALKAFAESKKDSKASYGIKQKEVAQHLISAMESNLLKPKAAESADGGMMTFDPATWKQTGSQLGSNPGGKYLAPNGKEYYVKFSKSDDHAKNEVLASKLYQAAGAPVLDANLITLPGGKLGTITEWEAKKEKFDPVLAVDLQGAQPHFAVHAWTGNWDAAGLSFDNQAFIKGKLTTVDVGGALLYRAQGTPKPFGMDVPEWETLRDYKVNPQSAHIFAGMTAGQLSASALAVESVSNHTINALVDKYGPGNQQQKETMKLMLKMRRDAIAQKALKASGASEKIIAPKPAAEPEQRHLTPDAKADLKNIAHTQPTHSVKPGMPNLDAAKYPASNSNAKSHNKKIDKIKELAEAGDVDGILALSFSSNTSGKLQAKMANEVLAALGGSASVKQASAKIATSEPEVKSKKPKFSASNLTAPPDFASPGFVNAVTGKTGPLSSLKHVNEANTQAAKKAFDLAQKGDLNELKALTFPEIDKATGNPTGKLLPYSQHPSSHVSGYYKSLVQEIDLQLNPPKKHRIKQSVSKLDKNGDHSALKPVPMGAAVAAVNAEFKAGEYIILGKVKNVAVPNANNAQVYDPKFVSAAKEHFKSLPSTAQASAYHYAGAGSGSMNTALQKGSISPAVQAHIDNLNATMVSVPEGTTFVRNMGNKGYNKKSTPEVIAKLQQFLLTADKGTVIQEPAFTSASVGAKSGTGYKDQVLGGNDIQWRFTAGPGVKTSPGWLTYNPGEAEAVFPPNQRYLILGAKKEGKTVVVDAVLLPSI